MTIFPSIFLILLLLVSPTLGDKHQRNIRESCIKEMNDARRAHAKSNNIANMNEMEYDMGLEKMISELVHEMKCKTYSTGMEYDVAASTVLSELGHASFSMNPTRTKLACARIKCDPDYEIQFIADKPAKPGNSITGTPGSKCPMGRVNEDGLCAKAEKDSGSASLSLIILPILMAIFYL